MSKLEIEAVWVVGGFEGEAARKVLANAHAGVGSYIILNEGGNRYSPSCMVAFRYVPDGEPIPHHLSEVKDKHKIEQYEKQRIARNG